MQLHTIKEDFIRIDKNLDSGVCSDETLSNRRDLMHRLHVLKQLEVNDFAQKAKIKWAVEGDENTKFFHGIINKRRSQLSIRGVFVDGDWRTDPVEVKEVFKEHFATRFKQPVHDRLKLNISFPNRLSNVQVEDLDRCVSRDEIRCGIWDIVDGNKPISLIGSVYKVVTKILANRLTTVISDLVSDSQSAFIANRQILDGLFILNELLSWCKRKKKQALIFKVDFAKAYDSVRWDYLLDVLHAFGFGPNWCKWIRGIFSSAMASILINGSPSSEFPFFCGLKQGDPLAPYLFILIMESLHISFSRVVSDGFFKGIDIQGSTSISHIFYADDAVFIGEWSEANLVNLVRILKCFYLASGLKINLIKSQLLGVGVPRYIVHQGASLVGCAVLQTPFKYLGISVGNQMSRKSAWENTIQKLHSRLSKWKVKTLSVGGRLTLLKSVLGSSPLYNMSIYKVPKGVLHDMESIRSKFFNGADLSERKITWVAWDRVLASKKNGGLGVSSFHALNRALLLKWVWRFISQDGSIWSRVIRAIYGTSIDLHSTKYTSNWCSILREVQVLSSKGFDFVSRCKKRVGNGCNTRFWLDIWVLDCPLSIRFPRIFALEIDKEVSVSVKMGANSIVDSFRRPIRDGVERQQWGDLSSILDTISLSSANDRWSCDVNGDGMFRVKDIRSSLDDIFLPSSALATRWVKYIPIKINIFIWRARLDRLPTRSNLANRGVVLDSLLCPICGSVPEDASHFLFQCGLSKLVFRKICRWWDLVPNDMSSFSDWDVWFSGIRLPCKLKLILEGVFYVAWWHIWRFRNQSIFAETPPRRSVLFDDIVSRAFDWYKARLVIKGFRQREGLDYFDTYSLVARITSIRMILAIVALRNLKVHQIDVKKAFLNGDLEEEIYMNQPKGFMAPGLESKVCSVIGDDRFVVRIIPTLPMVYSPVFLCESSQHFLGFSRLRLIVKSVAGLSPQPSRAESTTEPSPQSSRRRAEDVSRCCKGVMAVTVAGDLSSLHTSTTGCGWLLWETEHIAGDPGGKPRVIRPSRIKVVPSRSVLSFGDRETLMPLGEHAAHWANYLGELSSGVAVAPSLLAPSARRSKAGVTWQEDWVMESSATREYPSSSIPILETYKKKLLTELFLNPLRTKFSMMRYMAIVRRGQAAGKIPGRWLGSFAGTAKLVIPPSPPCTHSSDVAKLKKREKVLTRQGGGRGDEQGYDVDDWLRMGRHEDD
ncbi:RNA-directed DNA polymerase, eukaryota [Tanacetum coccineum]